jgi:hypothetical protein
MSALAAIIHLDLSALVGNTEATGIQDLYLARHNKEAPRSPCLALTDLSGSASR